MIQNKMTPIIVLLVILVVFTGFIVASIIVNTLWGHELNVLICMYYRLTDGDP